MMKWRVLCGWLLACVVVLFVDGGCSGDTEIPRGPGRPSVRVPDCKSGHVLAPGAEATLRVAVKDSQGDLAKDVEVLFVAPVAGPNGSFANHDALGPSYFKAKTDAQGIATATFIAGATPGIYLVDAVVEGAQASFAITNSTAAPPPVATDTVRCRIESDPALYTDKPSDQVVHGPLLLQAGTVVRPGLTVDDPPMPVFTAATPTWFFFIDDFAGAGFAHKTRFVTVDATTPDAPVNVIANQFWPVVLTGMDRTDVMPPSATNPRPVGTTAGKLTVDTKMLRPRNNHGGAGPKECAIVVHGFGVEQQIVDTAKEMRDFFANELGVSKVYMKTDAAGQPQIPNIADIGTLVDQAIADGCMKIYFFSVSHGFKGGASGFGNPTNTSTETPIRWQELADLLESKVAGRMINLCVILFACNSGSALQDFNGNGMTGDIVTSSSPEELSWLGGGTTYFTRDLLACWRDKARADVDGDGKVSLHEAFTWMKQNGRRDKQLDQDPQGQPLVERGVVIEGAPSFSIVCPQTTAEAIVTLPAEPPITESIAIGFASTADRNIAIVDGRVVFDDKTRQGKVRVTAGKTGETTYRVTVYLPPVGPFEAKGTIAVIACPQFQVSPISAVFNQELFTTTYTIGIANPAQEPIAISWDGPNCDQSVSDPPGPYTAISLGHTMRWKHEHPPCPAGTHDNVTVRALISAPGGTKICTFQGTDTNTGPPCK